MPLFAIGKLIHIGIERGSRDTHQFAYFRNCVFAGMIKLDCMSPFLTIQYLLSATLMPTRPCSFQPKFSS